MERRLSAIIAADIAGYSRLVGLDETGTFGRAGLPDEPTGKLAEPTVLH